MKTFNGKPLLVNIGASLIGVVGITMLAITWLWHVLAQYPMMPKHRWLNPLDRSTWVIDDNYPTAICYYYCNIEATMIHHLDLLRVDYDDDYCHVDSEDENGTK